MKITLLPLLGVFHLRFPLYNAVSVRRLLAASQSEAVVISALREADFETPCWQDGEHLPLAMTVVPWANKQQVPIHAVFEPSPDPSAEADFFRYVHQYPQLRKQLQEVELARQPVDDLLGQALSLARIQSELVPALRAYQTMREVRFEDGPGTDWLRQRVEVMVERITDLPYQHVSVLADVEHVPLLETLLGDRIVAPPILEPDEEERERSFLDFAFRVEVPNPENVLQKLHELASPEARYHQANLLLANGHPAEALEVLEQLSQGDFSRPYFLPGYVLARLGQLRAMNQDTAGASRAFRGVLALSYAPAEALSLAQEGLKERSL